MDLITEQILGGLVVSAIIMVVIVTVFVGWGSAMFCTWLFVSVSIGFAAPEKGRRSL